MHSKKTDGQQWSIRAEFTVSPQEAGAPVGQNTPSATSQDKSEIHLSYSWKTNENPNNISDIRNYRSVRNDTSRPVEYQRGNLIFTSTPPFRLQTATRGNNFEVQDSGYGSDLLSLNSLASGSSNSPSNPNNRRCRSTCSIVLCSNVCDKAEPNFATSGNSKCGRINSLRCQTSALHSAGHNAHFYGCGDPWCHHVRAEDESLLSGEKATSDLDNLSKRQSTSFLPHDTDFTGLKSYKRDVSIQTSDSLQKCSAASLGNYKKTSKGPDQTGPKNFSRNFYRYGQSPSSTGHAGEKIQSSSSRKPNVDKNCEISGHTSDSSKKSRTIHIDVYCTDTEIEPSESSSESWENDSTSTPQTVYESENMCVTHEKGRENKLPFKLKKYLRRKTSTPITSIDKDDSDDDGSSTNYPSKIGSYSTINDFSSSISSFKSWKDNSLSSFVNDADSIDNFSRASINSSIDRPSSYKRANSFGRKYTIHDARARKSINESTVYKNNQQVICQKPPQGYEKYISKRQNPDGSDSQIKNLTDEETTNKDTYKIKTITSDLSMKSGEKMQSSQNLTYDCTTSSQSKNLAFLTGQLTGQIASRFGQVINLSKKLGHHTGPAKNPDCDCEHCKRYFELLS